MTIKESKGYKALQKKLDRANQKVKSIVEEMRVFRGSKSILCGNCSKESSISDMLYVDWMRYSPSYSAYEDSSWDRDDIYGRFICPHCQAILKGGYKDELLSLRNDFGAVAERYPAEWYYNKVTWIFGKKEYTSQEAVFQAFTKLLEKRKNGNSLA